MFFDHTSSQIGRILKQVHGETKENILQPLSDTLTCGTCGEKYVFDEFSKTRSDLKPDPAIPYKIL